MTPGDGAAGRKGCHRAAGAVQSWPTGRVWPGAGREPAPDPAPHRGSRWATAKAAKKWLMNVKSIFWGKSSHLGPEARLSFLAICGCNEGAVAHHTPDWAWPSPSSDSASHFFSSWFIWVAEGCSNNFFRGLCEFPVGSLASGWSELLWPGWTWCEETIRAWKTPESFWEGTGHHCLKSSVNKALKSFQLLYCLYVVPMSHSQRQARDNWHLAEVIVSPEMSKMQSIISRFNNT